MACLAGIEPTTRHNDGNRLSRIPCCPNPAVSSCHDDDINLETHQLGCKLGGSIRLPLRISILDGEVLSLYVAKLAQALPKR